MAVEKDSPDACSEPSRLEQGRECGRSRWARLWVYTIPSVRRWGQRRFFPKQSVPFALE